MIDFSRFDSLVSLTLYFNTDAKCKQAIAESRWSDGDVVCPYCGQHHCYTRADGRYHCPHCKHNFSVLVGTIFQNTKISLVKWFVAMYLISSHKKGISSHQLGRDLGITQKTAWFILHKVRTLYGQTDEIALEGEVECDEMYLGGREKNKHFCKHTAGTQGTSTKTKAPIFGMSERTGRTAAFYVPDTKAETLRQYIQQFVADNASIFTDESKCYNGLKEAGYDHHRINHSEFQYSHDGITTNTIEGFWGHFKRMVFGIYHFVSKSYLQAYIDEAVYRWNTRNCTETYRFSEMFRKGIGVVDYEAIKARRAA